MVTSESVIYPARIVHTMERARPTAEAVAVSDGRIVAAGSLAELRELGPASVDDRFADRVLLPGFVEAHSHSFGGGFWQFPYCGYFARWAPDHRLWSGCTSIDAVIERLREAEAALTDPDQPLVAWGLDPIYFKGEGLTAAHLDRISTTRPVFIMHASIHLATVNTALMTREGIGPDTLVEGVPKDGAGMPIGELREPAALSLATGAIGELFGALLNDTAITHFGSLARNAGVTTLTDLGSMSIDDDGVIDRMRRIVDGPGFPARVSIFHNPGFGGPSDLDEAAALVHSRAAEGTAKLRFGHVKLVLDGSIQGFTARLRPPGYLGDRPNGLWLVPPEQIVDRLRPFHRTGITVHAHCNGDQTVDVFLDAVETVLAETPRWDHRHTVQHCQLTTAAQYRRMAALGLCVNLFTNHTYYWGDQHVEETVGFDRASRMNAAATALAEGVPLSMHSDSPVTPIGSLHVAWCAVNRLTATGRELGPAERISVADALRAVTIGAAYQLKMDDEIGSIAPGKLADFAVLAEDPLEVAPHELRDIPVWGTVLAGRPHPIPSYDN
ncbi:MAG: amidohydrolase [Acidimicrobiales bacterium]